jgi:hypothetical protein
VILGATAPSARNLREHRERPQQDAEYQGDGFGERSHCRDVDSIANCSGKSNRDLSHMIAHNISDVASIICEIQNATSRKPVSRFCNHIYVAYFQHFSSISSLYPSVIKSVRNVSSIRMTLL